MVACDSVKTIATFGSKAKLPPADLDILDIGGNDPELYLSEIDEPPDRKKTLNSVIIKPNYQTSGKPDNLKSFDPDRKQLHCIQKTSFKPRKANFHRARGFNPKQIHEAITPTIEYRHTGNKVIPYKANTETRGTQTDRTGPCKCARAVSAKNKRRRLDNKKNKSLVEALVKHHT